MKTKNKYLLQSELIYLWIPTLLAVSIFGCSLFEKRVETAEQALERASNQKIFFAPYDQVWKAAHISLKYTIASENQDYGVIETDYIKAVDGWLPPYKSKPDLPGSRYKLIFTFAKGKTNGRDSTCVNIEKKIEVFKNIISDSQIMPSDGEEEKVIFYRMEREILIDHALKKASETEKK